MTRKEALDWIHDPQRLDLDAPRRRELEQWLERDSELRDLDAQQQEVFNLLNEWRTPQPSEEFDERLYAQIAAERERGGSWSNRLGRLLSPRPALAAAAVAAALLLAIGLPTPEEPAAAPAVEKAALSPDEAEYYEALDQALDDVEMLVDFDAFAPGLEENRS